MKTLYLHGSPDFYGSGKVLLEILRIPGQATHAQVVFPHEGPLCEPVRALGIRVHIVNMGVLRKKYFTPLGIGSRLFLWIRATWQLSALIKKEQFDCVYVNSLNIIIGPWLRKREKVQLVWHLHEIVARPRILQQFLVGRLQKADRLITVSKATQEHWSTLLGRKVIHLLYNGIAPLPDLTVTASDQSLRQQIDQPELLIGMIARVQPWKGQWYLLQIIQEMLQDPQLSALGRFKVVIAGDAYPGYTHLEEELRKMILEKKLENFVIYLGYQQNVVALLSDLDLLIVPSVQPDPLPTVVLEAMACGVPVVATRQGGCLEMIEENVTGYFIPLEDAAASAKILVEKLSEKEMLKQAGQKGKQRVQQLFSLEAFQRNWLSLMKR